MRITLLVLLILSSSVSWSQSKKLDLDDMTIKGELHRDDRLLILSRQKNQLKDYVKLRKSYRDEMLQQLPEENKVQDFRPAK